MLSFTWLWVLGLIPLPLIYRWRRTPAKTNSQALKAPLFVAAALAESGYSKNNDWRSHYLIVLLSLCWLSALVGLARPVYVGDPVALPTTGRDILIAVDISGSMEREDMVLGGRQVNRLVAVKAVVGDFVVQRVGDRLGLVLFGEKAYLQTPLTFDRETMQMLLLEAQIGFAGNGTAIGDAIGLSIKRLQDRPKDNRVLILMTDGSNNTGALKPTEATDLAKRSGVKIYTIGIGAERQQQRGLFGSTTINPSADLDEKTLADIASTTGGQYFRARNPQELAAIYTRLNELEPIEQDAETIRPVTTLFHWPLGFGFLLSLIIFILKSRWEGLND
jgi:Ca-activated chloride channel family protein